MQLLKRWWKDESGLAITEFAIASSFFMLLLLGGFELARQVLVNQKVEKVAYISADVVSQSTILTINQMNEYLMAASQVMVPFTFGANGLVIITSVERDVGQSQRVRWRSTGGGTLVATSHIGAVGAVAELPGDLALNERDNVIVAEVFYRYNPMFAADGLYEQTDIYKTAVFKPRLGSLTTAPQ